MRRCHHRIYTVTNQLPFLQPVVFFISSSKSKLLEKMSSTAYLMPFYASVHSWTPTLTWLTQLPQCLPFDLNSVLRKPPSPFMPLLIPLFSTDQLLPELQSPPTSSEPFTKYPRPSGRVGVSRNVHIGVGELRVKARPQLMNTAPSMLSFSRKTN